MLNRYIIFCSAQGGRSNSSLARRLELIKQLVGERSIILCIDETGDKKAGKTTDYVALAVYWQLG